VKYAEGFLTVNVIDKGEGILPVAINKILNTDNFKASKLPCSSLAVNNFMLSLIGGKI